MYDRGWVGKLFPDRENEYWVIVVDPLNKLLPKNQIWCMTPAKEVVNILRKHYREIKLSTAEMNKWCSIILNANKKV